MILDIGLHLGMTTQIAVSIFDLDLYFMAHRLCKFDFPTTMKATVMILGIGLHLEMTTQQYPYLTSTYISWLTDL